MSNPFNLVPGRLNINAVAGDDFAVLLDFNVDLTGYTFEARILLDNQPSNRYQAITVTNTNLADGRITLSLSDAQTQALGALSNRKWFITWSQGGDIRTVLSGTFTLNPKWAVTDYSPTTENQTIVIETPTVSVEVIGGVGGAALWGDIQGDIEDQNDLIEYISSQIDSRAVVVNVLSYGAKGDGITDDSDAIQNAIDNETYLFFPDTGSEYIVSKELLVPSNRTITHAPTASLKKKNSSTGLGECSFYRNSDYDIGNTNITILGGIFYGNNLNQTRADNNADQMIGGVGLRFKNVKGLTLRGIKIVNPLSFSIQVGEIRDLIVSDITFYQDQFTPNQDGLHLNGDIKRFSISNLFGGTSDDMLAISPDDYNPGSFEMTVGDIEDGVVDGIFVNGADGFRDGIRMLYKSHSVRNVTIRNFYASLPGQALIMDHYMQPIGVGKAENIVLEKWAITKEAESNSVVQIDNNYDSITLRDIAVKNESFSSIVGSLVYQSGGSGDQLNIENCSIIDSNNTGSVYNCFFFQGGCVTNLVRINGFSYSRITGSSYDDFSLLYHEGSLNEIQANNIHCENLGKIISLYNSNSVGVAISNISTKNVNSIIDVAVGSVNAQVSNLIGNGLNILQVSSSSVSQINQLSLVNSTYSGTNLVIASGSSSSPIYVWETNNLFNLSGSDFLSDGNPIRRRSVNYNGIGNPSGFILDTTSSNDGPRLFSFHRNGVNRFDFGYDAASDLMFFSNGSSFIWQLSRTGVAGFYDSVTGTSFSANTGDFIVNSLSGGIKFGPTGNVRESFGIGSPEGNISADPGSTYRDTNNGFLYEKITGSGNTGWVNSIQYGGATSSTANQYLRRNAANNSYEFGNKTDYLTSIPTSGQAIAFNDNPVDQVFYINPAGDLADLQLILPSNSTSIPAQKVVFCCNHNITNLALTGATTIFNAPVAMNAGDCFQFYKMASNVWARVIT